MKRIGSGALALLALLIAAGGLRSPESAIAQNSKQKQKQGRPGISPVMACSTDFAASGTLEGTVTTGDELPAFPWVGGVEVQIRRVGSKDSLRTSTDTNTGGAFEFPNITEGSYEVWVEGSWHKSNFPYKDEFKQRPQHRFGVKITAGHTTTLPIVVHSGVELETIGNAEMTEVEARNGRLDGVIVTDDGYPAYPWVGGITIKIRRAGSSESLQSSAFVNLGGYFSFNSIPPGDYDLWVEGSWRHSDFPYKDDYKQRPQHIHGVKVSRTTRTSIKIVVNDGTALEDNRTPKFSTQSCHVISQ